jgi:m7GpppX diphosphatase
LKKELAHIQWVLNIIEGKTEVERVLFRCEEFVIAQDFKWADIKDVDNMHLTIIFSDPQLHSLRDLRGHHVPCLEKVEQCLKEVLEEKVGISTNRCRVFFHYPPTFYRLHIHVMSLSLESLNCRVERCHDFFLVIQNLKLKGDYYKDITLNNFVEK